MNIAAFYGHFLSFSGTKRRKEFWLCNGIALAISVTGGVIAGLGVPILPLLIISLSIWMFWAVAAQRSTDAFGSKWWAIGAYTASLIIGVVGQSQNIGSAVIIGQVITLTSFLVFGTAKSKASEQPEELEDQNQIDRDE